MSTKAKEKAEEEILERTSPPGQIIYRAVHDEGEHEIHRHWGGLAWSGLAAGLSMGFSLIAQALLITHIPQTQWRPLLVNLGYTVGFLIVILGRQQLFTENTLTAVLPYLAKPKSSMLLKVGRLWAVVLIANLVGAFAFACIIAKTSIFDVDIKNACSEIGHLVTQFGFWKTFCRAIFAGWLLALMVWLLPFAESARISVIAIITYLVGLGNFSHVIAGGIEGFYLVVASELSFGKFVGGFFVPALLGNVIGGVTMVAILSHLQFMTFGRGKDHLELKP